MAPHLATLLDDPYDAVRFIASRSLRTLPGFADFPYDTQADATARREAQLRVMGRWDGSRGRASRPGPQLLYASDGNIDVERLLGLLRERDNRNMLLRE
jgi:hypothetical protein